MANDVANDARRTFLKRLTGLLITVAGIHQFLVACGSNDSPSSTPSPSSSGGNCQANGTAVTIQAAHTPNHTLTIPTEDVIAGVQKTYTLTDNGSGHTHTVTLTAEDFANLKNNIGITEVSSSTGHTHSVTVACV